MAPQASTQLEIQKFEITDDCSFKMVKVEEGTFMMGNPQGGDDDERPVHPVQLDSFWLGQHLVSQNLWQEIMGTNPAQFRGLSRPIENITWYECIEFCNSLSKKLGLTPVYQVDKDLEDPNNLEYDEDEDFLVHLDHSANGFRLPSEAEWEFAAKGGNSSLDQIYAGGPSIEKMAWYRENGFSNSHPPSLKVPNAWGLFDMTGNLDEWCWDWFGDEYYQACENLGTVKNPLGPESGDRRVIRGGRWRDDASLCRVAYRGDGFPDVRRDDVGLRFARAAL